MPTERKKSALSETQDSESRACSASDDVESLQRQTDRRLDERQRDHRVSSSHHLLGTDPTKPAGHRGQGAWPLATYPGVPSLASSDAPVWLRRLGDIPGIDYEPLVAVDRTKLPRHNAEPQLERDEWDGTVRESLYWEDDDGESGTSASPAHDVAFGGLGAELSTRTLVKRLSEGLELPGEPSDYHFAIQGAAETLWARRRRESEVIGWYERLNWLDIRLLRSFPDAVRDEYADMHPGRSQFFSVAAFKNLADLYSREGFLQEALDAARLGEQFEQGQEAVAKLEERLAALRAEDGD